MLYVVKAGINISNSIGGKKRHTTIYSRCDSNKIQPIVPIFVALTIFVAGVRFSIHWLTLPSFQNFRLHNGTAKGIKQFCLNIFMSVWVL